jgi:hypothetical protein
MSISKESRIFPVTLMLFAAAIGWCGDPAFAGRKAVIFPITDLSVKGADTERQDRLSAAVDAEFRAAGFRLLPGGEGGTGPAEQRERLDGPAAAAVARNAQADVAVSGSFTIENDQIVVVLSCYEAQTGALAAGFLKSWHYNLTFYNNLRSEIEDMLARLNLPAPRGTEPETGEAVEITFTSRQEGMEVLLGGERSVGTIEKGKAVMPSGALKIGFPLLVEKRMPGYHTSWQSVRAGSEIALTPLARKTTVALEASWTAGEFLGGGGAARFYLLPDSLFLSAGLNVSFDPPVLSNAGTVAHFDTQVSVGQYLIFPPDSPFRLGIGTGFGTIFTAAAAAGPSVYTDVFWDVASLWVEWNLPRVSLFLRSDLKYTLGIGTNLLGRGILTWKASTSASSGSPVSARFPPLTLGVVIKL